MQTPILKRIARESGVSDLVEVLAERLSGSDFSSLMLEVYRQRASALSPAELLAQYSSHRFAKPARVAPEPMRAFESMAEACLPDGFECLELSPVSPLGACSAVAPVDQNKIVSAGRNTEVCADSTNALALEVALRRRAANTPGERRTRVKLAASHRLVRAQFFDDPDSVPHFRVFSLCTGGRDEGAFGFETSALFEQLDYWLRLLKLAKARFANTGIQVDLSDLSQGRMADELHERIVVPIRAAHKDVTLDLSDTRERGRGYYRGATFQIRVRNAAGDTIELADGGLVDWTASLLGNRKERLAISGFGVDRFVERFSPTST